MTALRRSPLARLALAVAFAALVFTAVRIGTDTALATLSAIGVGCLTFVVSGLVALWPMTGEQTRTHAKREDLNPLVEELLIVVLALGSLAVTGIVLAVGHSPRSAVAAVLGLVAAFSAWSMLHFMYSARYADIYYDAPDGGIDFNNDDLPSFRDFLYFGYNLGMTYQVSDTDVSSTRIRAVVLRHCLLSYVFGTVVLAATINVVAGVITN